MDRPRFIKKPTNRQPPAGERLSVILPRTNATKPTGNRPFGSIECAPIASAHHIRPATMEQTGVSRSEWPARRTGSDDINPISGRGLSAQSPPLQPYRKRRGTERPRSSSTGKRLALASRWHLPDVGEQSADRDPALPPHQPMQTDRVRIVATNRPPFGRGRSRTAPRKYRIFFWLTATRRD